MESHSTHVAPDSEDRWSELAMLAQEGDKQAYNALLREIAPFIQSSLLPGLANPDWADDITQNVLVSVHKSLKTYRPERPFKPWLRSIIGFRKADFLRKYYRNKQNGKIPLDSKEFLTRHVTTPVAAGEYRDIEAALSELPDRQRKVFELFKIKGFSAREVAKEVGMSVSAVKVSAHRTMKKLKERLG